MYDFLFEIFCPIIRNTYEKRTRTVWARPGFSQQNNKEVFVMNANVVKVLKEQLWYIATCCDTPNVVPVGFKDVGEDGKLYVGDVLMDTTMKNVKCNGKVAISVYDAAANEGYQVKGTAEYVTAGPAFDKYKAVADQKFNGVMTIKGLLIITPEKTIVTSAGPDNKKEI